jgi:hypothetical protein
MPLIDTHLLNKIESIKTLRDRAGTEGEKDAAQNKLTLILAKHKLTEQDIPSPDFSTRGRPFSPPQRRRSGSTFNQARWDDIFNQMRKAAAATPPHGRRDTSRPPGHERSPRNRKNRERFEASFGRPINDYAWDLVLNDFRKVKVLVNPKNPAAFARAYMESAALQIRDRIRRDRIPPTYFRRVAKSKNPQGMERGLDFAERVDLSLFS